MTSTFLTQPFPKPIQKQTTTFPLLCETILTYIPCSITEFWRTSWRTYTTYTTPACWIAPTIFFRNKPKRKTTLSFPGISTKIIERTLESTTISLTIIPAMSTKIFMLILELKFIAEFTLIPQITTISFFSTRTILTKLFDKIRAQKFIWTTIIT